MYGRIPWCFGLVQISATPNESWSLQTWSEVFCIIEFNLSDETVQDPPHKLADVEFVLPLQDSLTAFDTAQQVG